jgi:hypothetical protein
MAKRRSGAEGGAKGRDGDAPRATEPRRDEAPAFGKDDPFVRRAPRRLVDQVAELRRTSQAKIAAGLRSEEMQALFLRNPAEALDRLGVEVPRDLRRRLRRTHGLPDLDRLLRPAPIRLPDGRQLTPKVRIRITGGEDV